jgi:nucleoside-diphosphate-sugar epimerase
MRVLVTGGSGFLGAWIMRRLLARGIDCVAFDLAAKPQLLQALAPERAAAVQWRTGDIAQASNVSNALQGCDAVIHLAGILTPDCAANPVRGAQINLIGTLNVFGAARAAGLARVLYASSAGVFAPDDSAAPLPQTHYGAFKLACEGSARAYWHDHGIASVGFRPLVVYGAGRETGSSAGPSLACRAAARRALYDAVHGIDGLRIRRRCRRRLRSHIAARYRRRACVRARGRNRFSELGDRQNHSDRPGCAHRCGRGAAAYRHELSA